MWEPHLAENLLYSNACETINFPDKTTQKLMQIMLRLQKFIRATFTRRHTRLTYPAKS